MKALGDMGPLVIGALAPLAVTSAKHEPTALALGTFLSLLLGRMTFNLQPEPVVYDLVREQTALKSLMITSNLNRTVRLSLGAVYVYAAISYNKRLAESARSDNDKDKVPSTLAKIGSTATSWIGTFMLVFIGAVWCSSGYYGQ
jgi:hypothetical protein